MQEKQNKRFLSISRVAKIYYYCCYFVFFQDYRTFFIMKAKKSPSDFIKFLIFWSTLKTFDIKQRSPMTEEKEITISM